MVMLERLGPFQHLVAHFRILSLSIRRQLVAGFCIRVSARSRRIWGL
jgi:hypothetical protein